MTNAITARPEPNGQSANASGQVGAAIAQVLAQSKNNQPAPAYAPIGKTLRTLGITPDIRDVDGAECLVIPMAELIDKEWRYLTGGVL